MAGPTTGRHFTAERKNMIIQIVQESPLAADSRAVPTPVAQQQVPVTLRLLWRKSRRLEFAQQSLQRLGAAVGPTPGRRRDGLMQRRLKCCRVPTPDNLLRRVTGQQRGKSDEDVLEFTPQARLAEDRCDRVIEATHDGVLHLLDGARLDQHLETVDEERDRHTGRDFQISQPLGDVTVVLMRYWASGGATFDPEAVQVGLRCFVHDEAKP